MQIPVMSVFIKHSSLGKFDLLGSCLAPIFFLNVNSTFFQKISILLSWRVFFLLTSLPSVPGNFWLQKIFIGPMDLGLNKFSYYSTQCIGSGSQLSQVFDLTTCSYLENCLPLWNVQFSFIIFFILVSESILPQ